MAGTIKPGSRDSRDLDHIDLLLRLVDIALDVRGKRPLDLIKARNWLYRQREPAKRRARLR